MRGLWQRKAMSHYTGTPSLLSPSSIDRMGGCTSWKLQVPLGLPAEHLSLEMESDLFSVMRGRVGWGARLLAFSLRRWAAASSSLTLDLSTIRLFWTNPYLLLNDASLVARSQRGGSDGPRRGTRDLLGWWKYSASECGSGFMVHTPPNSSSCAL